MRFAVAVKRSCQPGAGGFVDGRRLEGDEQPLERFGRGFIAGGRIACANNSERAGLTAVRRCVALPGEGRLKAPLRGRQ
jgi:hypothetical protein